MISVLNLTILLFRKYFLKNTLANPFNAKIEFSRRLYIYFLAESFKAIEMKCNIIMPWGTFGNYIIKHASSNLLKGLSKHHHFQVIKEHGRALHLHVNCTSSPSSRTQKQEGCVDLRGDGKFGLDSFFMEEVVEIECVLFFIIGSTMNLRALSTLMQSCEILT